MIGTALAQSWMHDPVQIVRLVRRPGPPSVDNSAIPAIVWDPASSQPPPALDRFAGIEAVVHLSGASVAGGRWTQRYKQEIVSSRVQSTVSLAKLLGRLDQPPKVLVCASAIGIYGDRGDEELDEDSPPGTGFLAETCVAWEAAARAAEDAGIRVVHTRFGVVLSPHGGALAKMLPLFRLGLGGNLGSGRQWMPWITLRDAVGVLRSCIEREELRGPINTVSPAAVTNAEFTRSLGSAVNRPAFIPAPAFALRMAFGEMADEALLASARVLPMRLVKAGYRFADPELLPALRTLVS